MPATRLKLYQGPEERAVPTMSTTATGVPSVTAPLSEVMPLLADAIRNERTWLSDFGDDEVTLSADLYEVLLAYQFYRRPSA
jgi:hypothetical protein